MEEFTHEALPQHGAVLSEEELSSESDLFR